MKQQLLATLENSRKYTLQVADAMPADNYNFKPLHAGWNFKELLHHIAYGIYWWQQNFILQAEEAWEPVAVKKNKDEIIDYLTQVYDDLKKVIEDIELNDETIKGFHATLDHITHHRGQAVVYLRCNGINPPENMY